MDIITQALATEGLILEAEPGRALHNETGIHLATVHVVKHETENIDRVWAGPWPTVWRKPAPMWRLASARTFMISRLPIM